ncbi:hypothetical protein H4219_000767 [Mycoemilia scoparia]|uniref:Transmembrane protein 14C n=1 Tax=Mycoemilia scoparia TaxID=417184 RepID=A0A9W8A1V1_9FUNG|nr:hypothetical protein H4219_000767 [Mycoemilia scoparia]
MADHTALTMAAVCVTGGIIGFAKGKSIPSLVAGVGIGAFHRIRNNLDYGVDMALGTSVLLTGAMGPRAIRKRAPVPITMAVLGMASGAYYAKKAYEERYGV